MRIITHDDEKLHVRARELKHADITCVSAACANVCSYSFEQNHSQSHRILLEIAVVAIKMQYVCLCCHACICACTPARFSNSRLVVCKWPYCAVECIGVLPFTSAALTAHPMRTSKPTCVNVCACVCTYVLATHSMAPSDKTNMCVCICMYICRCVYIHTLCVYWYILHTSKMQTAIKSIHACMWIYIYIYIYIYARLLYIYIYIYITYMHWRHT